MVGESSVVGTALSRGKGDLEGWPFGGTTLTHHPYLPALGFAEWRWQLKREREEGGADDEVSATSKPKAGAVAPIPEGPCPCMQVCMPNT